MFEAGEGADAEEVIEEEERDRQFSAYKAYCLQYCVGLYYWYKTGKHPLISHLLLTDDLLLEYHYFSLRFDEMNRNTTLEIIGKMLGGGKKGRK